MNTIKTVCCCLFSAAALSLCGAAEIAHSFARYGAGEGPRLQEGVFHLLDAAGSKDQVNAVGFERQYAGRYRRVELSCQLQVAKGGDGGGVALLDTSHYGSSGAAPFSAKWEEPNFKGSFAVGIDVYNPKTSNIYDGNGNIAGHPQRELSLHWDGREIIKRRAAREFRDRFVKMRLTVDYVLGGANVTLVMGEEKIYENYFIAGMQPYEARLALGARTGEAVTSFAVKGLRLVAEKPVDKVEKPLRISVFNHVMTDNSKTSFDAEVDLPPRQFGIGRIILTLQIHDAGKDWDEWDRCGSLFVIDREGVKHNIVPFITSYKTTCYWQVDVTHFRQLLAGPTKLQIEAGTTFYKNRGYMMSVDLDFYRGIPELEPFKIIPLWNGVARYKSHENHYRDFFADKRITIDAETVAAKVSMITTGHSHFGEFTPSKREITFVPRAERPRENSIAFANRLWKEDCYLNPNRPQYGTWKFPRAGWAPGDICRPWWIDLSDHIQPSGEALLRYTPFKYDFVAWHGKEPSAKDVAEPNQNVISYLILYRKSAGLVAMPRLRLTRVIEGGSAHKAGLQVGDYVHSYDGVRPETGTDLLKAIDDAQKAGRKTVVVELYRGDEKMSFTLSSGLMQIRVR